MGVQVTLWNVVAVGNTAVAVDNFSAAAVANGAGIFSVVSGGDALSNCCVDVANVTASGNRGAWGFSVVVSVVGKVSLAVRHPFSW